MPTPRLLVLHGPNLDLLAKREPSVYGNVSLAEIETALESLARELGVEIESFQSNHEGALLDRIRDAAASGIDGYMINPGGLGHTSVSLRDALLAAGLPFVELHCSNIAARESFRRRSLLTDVAVGVVSGFGAASYTLALRALVGHLNETI